MTTLQIILMSCFYLVQLGAVVYFARATVRRVIGALAGGAVVGLMVLPLIALCEALGWWRVPFALKQDLSASGSQHTRGPAVWVSLWVQTQVRLTVEGQQLETSSRPTNRMLMAEFMWVF